jgi:hypothetical protein
MHVLCENSICLCTGVRAARLGLLREKDLMSSIMLISAVLASLGVGVLNANAVCVAMFAMFKSHARQVAAARVSKPAQPSQLEAMRG